MSRQLPLLALALLAARCDVPTSLPKWNTRWILATDSTRLAVAELLPADVTLTPGGQNFELDLAPVTFSRTLGEMCAQCAAQSGQTVPKPAFQFEFEDRISRPPDVIAATVTAGTVNVAVANGFSFDPLRPGGAVSGRLVIRILDGAAVLAADSVLGDQTAFPAGTTLTRPITLAAATVTGDLAVRVFISSPEGAVVTLNASQRLTVNADPGQVRLSEAQVSVQNKSVSAEEVDLDLEDVDDTFVERVKGGAFIFDIQNPFPVRGDFGLQITGPGTSIEKPFVVEAGSSSPRVEFTEVELKDILGSRSTLRASGTVTATAPSGAVPVRPDQVLQIKTKLDLTIASEG